MDWDNLDWADIFRRLVLFALKRRQARGVPGSLADAEDLAAEAIRLLLDSYYAPWNPHHEPDLLRHLGSTVNGLLSNELRTVRAKKERSISDPSILKSANEVIAPNGNAAEVDEYRRAIAMLERRVADDELIRRLLPLERDGITKAAAQAAQLEVGIDAIYKARRRLAGHRQAVRRELAKEGSSEKPRARKKKMEVVVNGANGPNGFGAQYRPDASEGPSCRRKS